MVAKIEAAPEQALVLIEEIENGLHPVATVRMIVVVSDRCGQRKKVQAIFTTHSNDALKPLPSKAIWVATQDRIFQGKLDIQSLRAMDQIEAQLVIFVEDNFAKVWIEALLRQSGGVALDHVQIHAMQGDGTAVAINHHHNSDPSQKVPSVCFIDGDSRQEASDDDRVYRLPGNSPEGYVFDQVMDSWDSFGGKLAVALLQRFENAESIKKLCEGVRLTNRDAHLLFSQVGEKLGLLPESTVALAFANLCAQSEPDIVRNILIPIDSMLPRESLNGSDKASPVPLIQ